MNRDLGYHKLLLPLAVGDALTLEGVDTQYRGSWQQRGGVGAFFTMIRSLDRLQAQVEKYDWNIFEALDRTADSPEGIANSLRDARRYLLLIEAAQTYARLMSKDSDRNLTARNDIFDHRANLSLSSPLFSLPGDTVRKFTLELTNKLPGITVGSPVSGPIVQDEDEDDFLEE